MTREFTPAEIKRILAQEKRRRERQAISDALELLRPHLCADCINSVNNSLPPPLVVRLRRKKR